MGHSTSLRHRRDFHHLFSNCLYSLCSTIVKVKKLRLRNSTLDYSAQYNSGNVGNYFQIAILSSIPRPGPLAPILFPSENLALDCFNHLDIKGSAEITIMAANRGWFLHLNNTLSQLCRPMEKPSQASSQT